jgi:hypothetical protein
MEIDAAPAVAGTGTSSAVPSAGDKKKPRFEIKKYNAVALWAWGMFVFRMRCHIPHYYFACTLRVMHLFSAGSTNL